MKPFLKLIVATATGILAINCTRASAASLPAPIGSAWSYGEYTNPNSPTSFAAFTSVGTVAGYPGLKIWSSGNGIDPNVIYNTTTSDILTDPNFGDIDFAAKTINLGPFNGPTVVRFTAPTAGVYSITADFKTAQLGNASPTAYVYVDGLPTPVYTSQLADPVGPSRFGADSIYSGGALLGVGDTLDFVVWGSNASNKTTQLSAAVSLPGGGLIGTAVPLAKADFAGALLLVGCGTAGIVRRRMKRLSRIS